MYLILLGFYINPIDLKSTIPNFVRIQIQFVYGVKHYHTLNSTFPQPRERCSWRSSPVLYSSAAILYIHIDNRLKGFLTAIHKMIDDTCILELQDIHVTRFTNESSIIKILMPYCMSSLWVQLSQHLRRWCYRKYVLRMPRFFPHFFSYYSSTKCSTSTMATGCDQGHVTPKGVPLGVRMCNRKLHNIPPSRAYSPVVTLVT